MTTYMKVTGIEEVKKMFGDVSPRVARNLVRQTVQKIASNIAKDAKENAPVDSGNLKSAIKAARTKSHPDRPISVVKVTEGRKAKGDAFYWHFVEYGTKFSLAKPFIAPAKKRAEASMSETFRAEFGKKFEKHLARAKK
jgi:HK97 gp10 family phage protein